MKKTTVYIGFFTYAGYDRLIISDTEENCWKAMKKEYYAWRKHWGSNPYFHTFEEAKDWFGYTVQEATTGTIIEY